MKILHYNDLITQKIPNYKKICQAIAADDFAAAQVKKIGDNLYRARLNRQDRLLFSLYRYQGETYALMLEWIKNHDYSRSRFLHRGAQIDEDLIQVMDSVPEVSDELTYVNPSHENFAWLGKCISFDDIQQAIYQTYPPLIIIGSAGSGKTAIMLEKLKQTTGDVLYVSLSAYLVKNAYDLYYSNHYTNDAQQVDFFSYQELLESIQLPHGEPINYPAFKQWFDKHKHGSGVDDAHKLFEEFRGVLTSTDIERGFLSFEDYQNLGVRQSIYLDNERKHVYELFKKYLKFVSHNSSEQDEQTYYDVNLISHQWLSKLKPRYDFVVVDEVQDFTSIQLYLILKMLKNTGQFLLCGDANQIVHPNFFSWAKVKTLFYQQADLQGGDELTRILHTNYRNSPQVTNIANRILQLKNIRFGSIDKESHYLVDSNSDVKGNAKLWQENSKLVEDLNNKTRRSTQFAVIVLYDEQKKEAKKHFNTPLIFSVQEAKGLEYDNVILYNFVSAEEKRFLHIAKEVKAEDLDGHELNYSRNKDKSDKSLEVYKFYINALYVALTRAIKNVYWIESRHKHPLFNLLQVAISQSDNLDDIEDSTSSIEAWQREAQKLAMQGKTEQAQQIRDELLQEKKANWTTYDQENLQQLLERALTKKEKKSGITLLEYAQVYDELNYYNALQHIELKAAQKPLHHNRKNLIQKHHYIFASNNTKNIEKKVDDFGIEYRDMFNRTPLMNAVWVGNTHLIERLIERGADIEAVDNQSLNALQLALKESMVTNRDLTESTEEHVEHKQKYAQQVLPAIYDVIAPDSISLQTQGRLVKLDKHSMEYFLVNIILAMLPKHRFKFFSDSDNYFYPSIETADILQVIEHMPSGVLPEYRRKRAYISSILSKNEVAKDDPYNRQLFYRVKRGHYILHPDIKIKRHGEWQLIFDYERCHLEGEDEFRKLMWNRIYDKDLIDLMPDIEGIPF